MNLALTFVWVALGASSAAGAAQLPDSLDADVVRDLVTQHDGRWPPLDTVARDVVRSVTGSMSFRDADPVTVLLAWTFEPEAWMREPLIRISNAELRGELQLSADRKVFSYDELRNHPRLLALFDELARADRGKKLDALQSKVSDIHEKLSLLQRVFAGRVIRVLPEPKDPLGAWLPIGSAEGRGQGSFDAAVGAWSRLRSAYIAQNGAEFANAAAELKRALATLPAAHRPDDASIATELRYNRLRPFHTASLLLPGGALIAALAMAVRRRWFDLFVAVAILIGLGVLSYGLWLRWHVAGRIPASNMFESLLFLAWGAAVFAVLSMAVFRDRLVPVTAAGMSAIALVLADRLPMDQFVRPIAPVLLDTVWMSIHVPIIMVSYSVLALAVLIAHLQLITLAAAPSRRDWAASIDMLHYWYVQIGSILLALGIITGSMWAACSWGRYWGWDPKEVWSLVALLGYLTILHIRINHEHTPRWVYVVGALLLIGLIGLVISRFGPLSTGKLIGLAGAVLGAGILVGTHGLFATAAKSILCFWLIIMTYVGVNYVLGAGLHSYGFGTGAVARYMFLIGGADLAFVLVAAVVYLLRRTTPRTVTPELVAV